VKYLAILAVCLGVYFAAQAAPQAQGTWFYVIQSMWSFGLLTAVLAIERSKLTFSIASIELLAIFLNLFACIGYITTFDYFYLRYSIILTAINITEVIILLTGVPLHGVFNRISELCGPNNNRGPSSRRFVSVNPISIREEGTM